MQDEPIFGTQGESAYIPGLEENKKPDANNAEKEIKKEPAKVPDAPAQPSPEKVSPEKTVPMKDAPAIPVGDPVIWPSGDRPIGPGNPADPRMEMVPAAYTYRWTYGEQVKHDQKQKKKRRKNGALTYALMMSLAFLLCFGTLLGVILTSGLITGNDMAGQSDPPAVVTQVVEKIVYVTEKEGDDGDGYMSIPRIAEEVKPCVVGISVTTETGSGTGTGIVMTTDGYIATNAHVVDDAVTCTVVLSDGTEHEARVIGFDEWSDLAVIKIEKTGMTPARFGDSGTLIVGESVVAIGTPAGLDFAGTVTDGIVSALNRNVKIYNDDGTMLKKMTLIQTNTAINPGNSGGPLLNRQGEVIGITSMKLSNGYVGIGFAIPITGAMEVLQGIIDHNGYVGDGTSSLVTKRPLLGIRAGGCQAGVTTQLDDGTTVIAAVDGVIIVSLTDGLNASEQLRAGDIITKVQGKPVRDIYQVMDIVNNYNPGDSIELEYYRDGVYATATIVLGSE